MTNLTPIILIVLCTITHISSYTTVLPQRASYFVGRDVNIHNNNNRNSGSSGSTLEMKNRKPNVHPAMRQQYKRAQEMESYRKEMMESQVRREFFYSEQHC